MANDLYKAVNLTAGQEVRAADLTNISKFLGAKLGDSILDKLAPGLLVAAGDPDLNAAANAATKWSYALTLGGAMPVVGGTGVDKKVKISAGTVFQKIASATGDEAQLLSYTFDGTTELTLDNGHATLPRVDLIQMKLEWESGDSQSRVFAQEAEFATIDFGALTANFDTVLRARVKGFSGNSITVRTVTGLVFSIVEAGAFVTITYVDGVTTVTDIETEITANSTLLYVDTPGTGANILVDPADTQAYTALTGGIDTVFVSSNVNMQRRVKATVNVRNGVAGAAPVVMTDPDAGFVPLAAIVVHPTWDGTTGFDYDDHPTASVTAVIMDMRMPLSVKRHTVYARDMIYDEAYWTLKGGKTYVQDQGNKVITDNISAFDFVADDMTEWDTASGQYIRSLAATTIWIPIAARTGYSIVGYSWSFYGDGAVDATLVLKHNRTTVWTDLDTSAQSNVAAVWGGASTTITPQEIVEGDSLYFQIGVLAANLRLKNFTVMWKPTAEVDAVSADLMIPCPSHGRLVGLRVTSEKAGDPLVDVPETEAYLCSWSLATSDLQKVGGYTGDLFADTTAEVNHGGLDVIEDPTHCEAEAAKGSATYGMPIWTSGKRALIRDFEDEGDGAIAGHLPVLALRVTSHDNPDNVRVYRVTFFVAEGL